MPADATRERCRWFPDTTCVVGLPSPQNKRSSGPPCRRQAFVLTRLDDPLPSSRDLDRLGEQRLPPFSIVQIPLDRLANPLARRMQRLPTQLGLDLC